MRAYMRQRMRTEIPQETPRGGRARRIWGTRRAEAGRTTSSVLPDMRLRTLTTAQTKGQSPKVPWRIAHKRRSKPVSLDRPTSGLRWRAARRTQKITGGYQKWRVSSYRQIWQIRQSTPAYTAQGVACAQGDVCPPYFSGAEQGPERCSLPETNAE